MGCRLPGSADVCTVVSDLHATHAESEIKCKLLRDDNLALSALD